MANHTPGPWDVGSNLVIWGEFSNLGMFTVAKVVKRVKVSCKRGDFADIKEATANARLIAAAPELLEALEEAMESAELDAQHDIEKYIRVINKAKGLSQ